MLGALAIPRKTKSVPHSKQTRTYIEFSGRRYDSKLRMQIIYNSASDCFQKISPPMMVMDQQHDESKESGERTLCAGGAQRRLMKNSSQTHIIFVSKKIQLQVMDIFYD